MLKSTTPSFRITLILFLAFFLTDCSFLGGYNAKSHEHLTALKAAHLKFIDTFTEGGDRTYDAKKLNDESDTIDLKFREALEFSKSCDDRNRTSNIQFLKEIFEEDLTNMKGKGRLLTDIEAKTLAEPSGDAYDRAIKGECARPGSDCK